jgi:FimV-like protein
MLMLESLHVVLRGCARLLLVGGAVAYSALAPALGLGEITLHSALNQPLRADIALMDAAGLAEGELSVSLATAEEFSRAGVDRAFFLNDLKFTPILRGDRRLIRVSSNKPVNEPFLNFLVQLNQPNGRVLREYTVLIDPPGAPGIVPVADEPVASTQSSGFPSVEPAVAVAPAVKSKKPLTPPVEQPAAAPVTDPVAEQLAVSVLKNQALQTTIDELNAKLQAQNEHIAGQKKQVTELQTQLAQVTQAAVAPVAPVAPDVAAPAPVAVEKIETTHWPLIYGVLLLVALALLGWFIRRRRQQVQAAPEPLAVLPSRQEPVLDRQAQPPAPASGQGEESSAGDVLEGVGIYLAYGRFSEAAGVLREALVKEPNRTDLAVQLLEVLGRQGDVSAYEAQENSLRDTGFDPHQLQEMRERYPKLGTVAALAIAPNVAPNISPNITPPLVAPPQAAASDEFQLNLDDLSMDSNWDLISPFDTSPPAAASPNEPSRPHEPEFTSNLHVLPDVFEMPDEPTLDEPAFEWVAEPDAQPLDDDFLDGFADTGLSLELEPLSAEDPEPSESSNAGKLEQAQTCIDDGDLDSAIELLNELLKDGDEPLRQTARSLLAGIR